MSQDISDIDNVSNVSNVSDTGFNAYLDVSFMQLALLQAQIASDMGEVPVGAVLVQNLNNNVIAVGYNRVITAHDPSSHAEIVALRAAGAVLNNYRLPNTTLYVTLEPCAMCLAAIFHARITRVVFGASDTKTGACGGNIDLRYLSINHHTTDIVGGVLREECAIALQTFFKARRTAIKNLKK